MKIKNNVIFNPTTNIDYTIVSIDKFITRIIYITNTTIIYIHVATVIIIYCCTSFFFNCNH